jgi:hypothetical protein
VAVIAGLTRQIAYRPEAGNRIPEVAAYGRELRRALRGHRRGRRPGRQRLASCPTLNAPSRETQANPLLDNYEGMAVTAGGPGLAGVSLISDVPGYRLRAGSPPAGRPSSRRREFGLRSLTAP